MMDPSIIIKLLEEDEDESMHSDADVDALTEALNRDIEWNDSSINPMDSVADRDAGVLSQDDSSTLNNNLQFTEHLPQLEQVKKISSSCYLNQHIDSQLQCDHILLQHGNTRCNSQRGHSDSFSEQNVVNSPSQGMPQHSKEQKHKVQQFNNQQPPNTDLSNNPLKWMLQKSSLQLDILVPKLQPLLDKDRSMQLQALYIKLLNNEISKENFLKVCKNIVGDRMIREAAVHQVQMQVQAQAAWQSNQKQYLSHAPVVPEKIDVKGGHVTRASATSGSAVDSDGVLSKVSMKAVSNTQQYLPTVETLFSMYGRNFQAHAYSRPSIGTTSTSLELQNQSSQMRQSTINPSISSSKLVSTQPMNIAILQNYELQKAVKNHRKMYAGSTSQMVNQHHKQVSWQQSSSSITSKEPNCVSQTMGYVGQNSIYHDSESLKQPQFSVPQSSFTSVHGDKGPETLKDGLHEKKLSIACDHINASAIGKIPSPEAVVTNSIMQNQVQSQSQILSLISGTNIKFIPKKPSIGPIKAIESSGNSPAQARKKQKTSGAFLDQSIEQLNDVTAVSGVNLRVEEEQLLVARKEKTQASEAIQRVVREEEERSILQKGPLQKKLAQIISRCGLGGISNDVEQCLSMCVEERLRSFIGNLIRLSKQRVDIEKMRHRLVVTSDVQHQILILQKKAKKEWEKKQAEESEKFRELNNDLADVGTDVEKDKDDRPSKRHKYHRKEDDKMGATAANAAARAAIGVDDMLSKWQLMAEQARQKRDSKLTVSSSHQQGSSMDENHSLNFGENLGNQQEDGGMSKHGRSIGIMYNPKIDRIICTKDVIATLEKEPMMSRSTLIYRLYERTSSSFDAG